MSKSIKVCLVNNCFPIYSTGTIANTIYEKLNGSNIQIYVAYAWDKKEAQNLSAGVYRYGIQLDKYISAVLTRLTGNYFGYAYCSTARLILFLRKIKPDIVHIHCANAYSTNHYILLAWCRKNGIKVIATEHAEYYHTGNCSFSYSCDKWKTGCGNCPDLYSAVKSRFLDRTAGNWKKMYRAFSGWGNNLVVTAVSPWLAERSRQSPITGQCKTVCIENGIDTDCFYYRADDRAFRYSNYFDERSILFVAPKYLSGVKGGEYLFELARRLPEYRFIVVGVSDVKNAPKNISFLGYTESREELSRVYSYAKITLLTSKTETFSLVTAESLCCGTPVVGFQCGGAESIALKAYAEFVEQGNIDQLESAIRKWINCDVDKNEISQDARNRYSCQRMVMEYKKLYEELFSSFKE